MDWAETKGILLDLEQLFSRDNDIRDVVDIAKMAREIEIHRDSKLKNAKELIKGIDFCIFMSYVSDLLFSVHYRAYSYGCV